MEYTAHPTAPWPTTQARPSASLTTPQWPTYNQPAQPPEPTRVATNQWTPDPACVIRGFAKELVDMRTIQVNGELVDTAILLLETSPGRVVPVSCWGTKKIDYVRQGIGKTCDIVFTISCQTRQVELKETGQPTTIYNASLKLKSCLWV